MSAEIIQYPYEKGGYGGYQRRLIEMSDEAFFAECERIGVDTSHLSKLKRANRIVPVEVLVARAIVVIAASLITAIMVASIYMLLIKII